MLCLFSACEACVSLELEESPHHPLVRVGNCVPLEDSLIGEPDCVTIRLPRESGDQACACAVRDIPREVCFGPLLEEKEEDVERTSSLWMLVRRGVCLALCCGCNRCYSRCLFWWMQLCFRKIRRPLSCSALLLSFSHSQLNCLILEDRDRIKTATLRSTLSNHLNVG